MQLNINKLKLTAKRNIIFGSPAIKIKKIIVKELRINYKGSE